MSNTNKKNMYIFLSKLIQPLKLTTLVFRYTLCSYSINYYGLWYIYINNLIINVTIINVCINHRL